MLKSFFALSIMALWRREDAAPFGLHTGAVKLPLLLFRCFRGVSDSVAGLEQLD